MASLISISVALSQTPAYAVRPQTGVPVADPELLARGSKFSGQRGGAWGGYFPRKFF